MADLDVEFLGLELPNPVVAAASPATETVEGIVACSRAGVAVAITKSIAAFDRSCYAHGFRRTHLSSRGLWATSVFSRETLQVDEGVRLVEESARKARIPVIASIAAADLRPESWIPACTALEASGAAALQLDLFYSCEDWTDAESGALLGALLTEAANAVAIPVMPKLNIDMPLGMILGASSAADVGALSLLDSITVPPPIQIPSGRPLFQYMTRPNRASLFGSWQLPLTLRHINRLHLATSLELCAGGGLMCAEDALEAILLGATTAQFATLILLRGFDAIRQLLVDLESLVADSGSSLSSLRGRASQYFGSETESRFDRAWAVVDASLCSDCGVCTEQAFCGAFRLEQGWPHVVQDECDGCALCTLLCPSGAIRLDGVVDDSPADGTDPI